MDESAINALAIVQIALGFASCDFPVAVQFFPKLHFHPCDYIIMTPRWLLGNQMLYTFGMYSVTMATMVAKDLCTKDVAPSLCFISSRVLGNLAWQGLR